MGSVLITGASGFIGRHVGQFLSHLGQTIWCTARPDEHDVPWLVASDDIAQIPWERMPQVDTLVHLAAETDPQHPDKEHVLKTNCHDAIRLFKQALDRGVQRIVYASSCAVYGDGPVPFREHQVLRPLTHYAHSKALLDEMADSLAWKSQKSIVGLRFSNVYGEGEHHKGNNASMVSRLLWQAARGRPRLFHDGSQRRDWVYVRDVVRAVVQACGAPSGVYNVGFGISYSFNQVVGMWSKLLDTPLHTDYIDNPYQGQYQSYTRVDIKKAGDGFNWWPEYDLQDGMTDYFKRISK